MLSNSMPVAANSTDPPPTFTVQVNDVSTITIASLLFLIASPSDDTEMVLLRTDQPS
jgi:hypothetical protein